MVAAAEAQDAAAEPRRLPRGDGRCSNVPPELQAIAAGCPQDTDPAGVPKRTVRGVRSLRLVHDHMSKQKWARSSAAPSQPCLKLSIA